MMEIHSSNPVKNSNNSSINPRSGSPSQESKKTGINSNSTTAMPPPKTAEKIGRRKTELQAELISLQKKEKELLDALIPTNNALHELGVPSSMIYDEDYLSKINRLNASGLKFNDPNKLSFRGEDKAREYFQLLDLNDDGYIGYEEYRALNALNHPFGLIYDPAYQSNLAWKVLMANDGYRLDMVQIMSYLNNDPSIPEPQIDIDGYVRYRQQIEYKQNLSRELEILGIPYLPNYLMEWKKLKKAINEILEIRPFVKTFTKEELAELDGYLIIDEMLFIVNTLGFNFSKPEFTLLMLWRKRKAIVLLQLLRVYAKRNISQQEYGFELDQKNEIKVRFHQEEGLILTEHINRVRIEEFIAWFIALPKFIQFEKLWYRKFMKWKFWIHRGIRKVDSFCRFLFNFAAHFNDRLVLRDFLPINRLNKFLQEVSNFKYSIDIGNFELNPLTSEKYPGISMNWKLIKIENPETMLKSYNMPQGTSTVFVLEFLLKPNISADKQEKLVDLIRFFIQNNLEKEFKNNNMNFAGIQISCLLNEIDENYVLRIMISYKKVVSIDRFFEHLLLEYRIYDLVTVFVGEIKTNINIQNMLQHHLHCLNDSISMQFTTTMAVRKNLFMAIIRRAIIALSSGLTEDQANALNNPNTSEKGSDGNKKKNLNENEKNSLKTTSQTMKKDGKVMKNLSTLANTRKQRIQVVPKLQKIEEEEELLRYNRWKLIYPSYNKVKTYLEFLYQLINPFQSGIFRYSFRNLADFRNKLSILWYDLPWSNHHTNNHSNANDLASKVANSSNPSASNDQPIRPESIWYEIFHWITDNLLYEKGYFYMNYKEIVEEFQFEFHSLFMKLKSFLENRKREDDEKRLKALITFNPADLTNNDQAIQQDYMKKQLLATQSNNNNGGGPGDDDQDQVQNPIDYIRELEMKQRLQDVNNLRLLELCKECIVGINVIDIISGKNKLSFIIQDFDLFDLFPLIHTNSFEPPSMTSPEEGQTNHHGTATADGKKKKVVKGESMDEIFRRTNLTRNKKARTTAPEGGK